MERMVAKNDNHSEGSNKERKHYRDLQYQREEGGYSNPYYSNSYTPTPKHHHKYRTPTYPNKPKVDLPSFLRKRQCRKIFRLRDKG